LPPVPETSRPTGFKTYPPTNEKIQNDHWGTLTIKVTVNPSAFSTQGLIKYTKQTGLDKLTLLGNLQAKVDFDSVNDHYGNGTYIDTYIDKDGKTQQKERQRNMSETSGPDRCIIYSKEEDDYDVEAWIKNTKGAIHVENRKSAPDPIPIRATELSLVQVTEGGKSTIELQPKVEVNVEDLKSVIDVWTEDDFLSWVANLFDVVDDKVNDKVTSESTKLANKLAGAQLK
jgi:hypothetical protein